MTRLKSVSIRMLLWLSGHGYRAIVLAIVSTLFSVARLNAARPQMFSTVEQLTASYKNEPTVYWLESSDRSVHKSVSHSEFFKEKLFPWTKRRHQRSPWSGSIVVARSGICTISSFAVNGGDVLALDRDTHSICRYRTNSEEILDAKLPFSRPTSIALCGDLLYIADPGANSLFVYSIREQRLLQAFHHGNELQPDKIIVNGEELLGMNYAHKVLFRMTIKTKKDNPSDKCGLISSSQQITLGDLTTPVDFAASGSLVYILDTAQEVFAAFSLYGSELTLVPYKGMIGSPTALAGDFVDHPRLIIADSSSKQIR